MEIKTNNRDILCVIPARAGSKGVVNKNVIEFGGKPMMAWTIEAAVNVPLIKQVIVSTESDKIGEIARVWGAETPFIRPKKFSDDAMHAIHAVFHALSWYKKANDSFPYGVMMLLPTSPLRTKKHVEIAVRMFLDREATAVIGVVDLGKHMTNLRFLNQSELIRVAPQFEANKQRQGSAPLYSVSGAMFLARTDLLIEKNTFHLEGALGFVMDQFSAIDVNYPEDLFLARWLKSRNWSDEIIN